MHELSLATDVFEQNAVCHPRAYLSTSISVYTDVLECARIAATSDLVPTLYEDCVVDLGIADQLSH